MKKVSLGLALALSTAFCGEIVAESNFKSGVYAGIGGGYGTARANIERNLSIPGASTKRKQNLSLDGGIGRVYLGGDFITDGFLIGLEMTGALMSLEGQNQLDSTLVTSEPSRLKVKMKNSVDIVARFGGVIQDAVLAYVKVGAVSSKFEIDSLVSVTGYTDPSNAHRLKGYLLGAGAQMSLASIVEGLEVGVDLNYHHYNSKVSVMNVRDSTRYFDTSARPKVGTAEVKLIYKI
jgi:opacity protein-like surface antigen